MGEQDVTDTNVNALVGQRLLLSCQLTPDGGPQITNYQWTVPGTALADFYVSPDPLQTNGYAVQLTNKTTNTVQFCWVDPGTKLVSCTVTATGNTWSAKTWFQVKRPNATLQANIEADVEVYNNQSSASRATRVKELLSGGGTRIPTGIGSGFSWATSYIVTKTARPANGPEERGLVWIPLTLIQTSTDSPYTELPAGGSTTTADGSFTTYLAFRPTTADVLVPIRQIHWNWEGEAFTNGAGIWTLGYGTAKCRSCRLIGSVPQFHGLTT